ncbi:MAG: hypothetical protein GC159_21120 [Phycisphaera sp.]|nr:hypothetical protein [Phycisphaera sp.]
MPYAGSRGSEPLELDRSHLRKATYAATKLCGEFPRALPRLVGDADAWRDAVGFQLDRLKAPINHGEPLLADLFATPGRYSDAVRRRAARLRERAPELSRVIAATSWVACARIGVEQKYLSWYESNDERIVRILEATPEAEAVPLVLQLAHLAVDIGPQRVAPLVELLSLRETYTASTKGGGRYVEQLAKAVAMQRQRRKPLTGTPVEPKLPAALRELTGWLLTVEPRARRQSLRVLERCGIPELVGACANWWKRIGDLADEIRKLPPGATGGLSASAFEVPHEWWARVYR